MDELQKSQEKLDKMVKKFEEDLDLCLKYGMKKEDFYLLLDKHFLIEMQRDVIKSEKEIKELKEKYI